MSVATDTLEFWGAAMTAPGASGVSHSLPTSESTSVPDSSAIRRSTQCGRYRSGNHCRGDSRLQPDEVADKSVLSAEVGRRKPTQAGDCRV